MVCPVLHSHLFLDVIGHSAAASADVFVIMSSRHRNNNWSVIGKTNVDVG